MFMLPFKSQPLDYSPEATVDWYLRRDIFFLVCFVFILDFIPFLLQFSHRQFTLTSWYWNPSYGYLWHNQD